MAGLQRKTDKGEKYFVVRRDGTIPSWPKFVLGARDPAAPAALMAYAAAAERIGFDVAYVRDVRDLAAEFEKYRATHGTGKPDGEPERTDDPDTVSMMMTGGVLWSSRAMRKLFELRNHISGILGWAESARSAIQQLNDIVDLTRAAGVDQPGSALPPPDFAFVATKETPVTYGAVRPTREWAATESRTLTERAILLLEESLANPNHSSTRWQKLARLLVDEWRTPSIPMESIIDVARTLRPEDHLTLARHLPAVARKLDQLAKAEWVIEALEDGRIGMRRLEEYRQTYKAEPPEVGPDGRVR